jgi:galactokinase
MATLEQLLETLTPGRDPPQESDLAAHGHFLDVCSRALSHLPGVDLRRELSAFFVPGRIEIFGKHTDYAGGRSLLAATDQGFRLIAIGRDDATIRLVALSADGHEEVEEFPFAADLAPVAGHWRNYPQTVARRLVRNFGPSARAPLRGADIALVSDLPPAAGLSSSSALVIGSYLALAGVNRLDETKLYRKAIKSPVDLAMYLATVENGRSFGALEGDRGVGTFGGSEDHTIIVCARAGYVSQYSFAPTRHEADVAWPADMVFVIGTCGVIAEKTGARMADYNQLAEQAQAMVQAFNEARGTRCRHLRECLKTLRSKDETLEHFMAHLVAMRRELAAWDFPGRAMQFRDEDDHLVPAAAEALRLEDWDALGELAERSHELAEFCLKNQTPETNALERLARETGAVAASAFGAGFGGSVWAVVPAERAARFLSHWREAYSKAFPEPARSAAFFVTHPSSAARRLLKLSGSAE